MEAPVYNVFSFIQSSSPTNAKMRSGVAPIHIQLWLFDAEISEEFVVTLIAIIDWAGILIYMYKVWQGWILSIVLLRFIIKILICQTNIQIDKQFFQQHCEVYTSIIFESKWLNIWYKTPIKNSALSDRRGILKAKVTVNLQEAEHFCLWDLLFKIYSIWKTIFSSSFSDKSIVWTQQSEGAVADGNILLFHLILWYLWLIMIIIIKINYTQFTYYHIFQNRFLCS